MNIGESGRTGVVVVCLVWGGLALASCGEDRAPATAVATPVAAAVTVADVVPPATDNAPKVTVMPDGSLELRPRINDVAMLERQPDGSYRHRCGPPSPETRTTMETRRDGMMRAGRTK